MFPSDSFGTGTLGIDDGLQSLVLIFLLLLRVSCFLGAPFITFSLSLSLNVATRLAFVTLSNNLMVLFVIKVFIDSLGTY